MQGDEDGETETGKGRERPAIVNLFLGWFGLTASLPGGAKERRKRERREGREGRG